MGGAEGEVGGVEELVDLEWRMDGGADYWCGL